MQLILLGTGGQGDFYGTNLPQGKDDPGVGGMEIGKVEMRIVTAGQYLSSLTVTLLPVRGQTQHRVYCELSITLIKT